MNKFYIALCLLVFSGMLSAQQWVQNLPQDKLQNGELTYYEIQKAFNDYWDPFNVENGYYEVNGEQIKAPYWKQFKRWEWYWESRIDPSTGEFPKTSAYEELQKFLKDNPDTKSLSGNWSSMGPSSTSGGYAGLGRLNCVAFRTGDNSTIYVGSPSGGIWKTTNGGTNWTPLGDNNAVLGVSDIVVIAGATTATDIVYIATGDRDGGSMWSLGGGQSNDNNSVGILKSTDGGATWSTTGLSWSASQKRLINRLLVDPGNSSILYAATSIGLYKTTNAGTSWSSLTGTNYVDIKFKPGTSSTIYASNWYGDIHRSTNSGASFSSVFSSSYGRVELAVSANNSNIVYAVIESGGGLAGIYKSTNGGGSFSQVFSGSTTNLLNNACNSTTSGGQGGYDLCIAADPNNVNNVFVGGVNTWRSTNGGSSWSLSHHWTSTWGCGVPEVHADQHFLAYQNGTSILYECNDGGLYRTSNNGSSWTHHGSGLVTSQLYRLGVAQTTSNEAICGLQDNGTKALIGGTWYDVVSGDGMECAIDYTNQNTQYGESQYGNLRRTTNHWSSSTGITSGLSGSVWWVMPFVIDPNVNTTIYAGHQDVFKSTNQGNSWSQISTFGSSSTLRSLTVAPSNSSYIYAATTSTLYKTTNGGTSWSNITGTLPVGSGSITYVWVKSNNPNTIWVSLGGYNSYGVYESTNGGTSWTNISAGLPSLPVMCVIQNKQNTVQNELYAGTDVGVYVKVGTSNWIPFYTGLPNVVVAELDIYYDNTTPANSRIRAATFGRGMWESDMYSPVAPPVADFSANNLYPLANQPVAFTDLSSNSPTSWSWSFNPSTIMYAGGTNASSQNPQVQFLNNGAYTVALTATNAAGSNTNTRTDYIHVGQQGLWIGGAVANPMDWNTNLNWENHEVPLSTTNVSITPIAVNWPLKIGNLVIGTDCNQLDMFSYSELIVIGDLTIQSGKTFNADPTGATIIRVDGNWTNNGTFSPGLSTVEFVGSTDKIANSPSSSSNNNLTTVYSSQYTIFSNYFDISASGGFDISVGSFDVNVSSTGPVNVEIWYRTDTYVGHQNSIVGWNQLGTTQIVTGSGSNIPTYVDPGASITIPSGANYGFFISCYDNVPTGLIVFPAGNNTYSNMDISIVCGDACSSQQPGSGTVYSGYTFSGTVYYSYSVVGSLSFWNLDVSKQNAALAINSNSNIGNDLFVKPGSFLTNGTGNTLTVNGNTTFEADAGGMASFIDNGTSVFANPVDIQLYLIDGRWHFVGIPVNSAAAGVFHLSSGHSDIYLRTHNESTNTWNPWIVPVTTPLALGRGYETWVGDPQGFSQPETLTFTGTPNNGSYTTGAGGFYGLQYTSGHGLNMIANPYPSALQGNINTWSKNNLANSIWTWSKTYGNYVYWGSGNDYGSGNFGTMTGGVIPAMQGFFVEATGSSPIPSVTIPQTDRIHNNQAFYKESEIPSNTLQMEVNANGYKDIIFVTFNEQATEGYDNNYDVRKLFGLEEAPQLFSMITGQQLSINALPVLTEYRTVQLGFECGLPGTYSFIVSDIGSFDGFVSVYLEDTKEGTLQNLVSNPVYSFTYGLSDEPTRFVLHFGNPNGIGDESLSTISIYSHGDIVYIQGLNGFNGHVSIYDMLGQELISQKTTGNGLISIPIKSGTGYYFVKVQSDNQFVNEKVFIK
jgi:hypothetical protein